MKKPRLRGFAAMASKVLLLDDVVLKHLRCPNGKFDATQIRRADIAQR
jgi:hypothetical protein